MPTRSYTTLAGYYLDVPNVLGQYGSMVMRALRVNRHSAGDRWLQIHASLPGAALPLDGAVPLYAPLLLPGNYISEDTWPEGRVVPLPGTKLIVSSTSATLTRDATAIDDITVDVDEFELQPTGTVLIAGDATTPRKSLQVWAESAGPLRLLKVELQNTAVTAIYLQVFATDSPADAAVPLLVIPLAASTAYVFSFGNSSGLAPVRQDADATRHQGCTLVFSSTGPTKTLVAANSGVIKAFYK